MKDTTKLLLSNGDMFKLICDKCREFLKQGKDARDTIGIHECLLKAIDSGTVYFAHLITSRFRVKHFTIPTPPEVAWILSTDYMIYFALLRNVATSRDFEYHKASYYTDVEFRTLGIKADLISKNGKLKTKVSCKSLREAGIRYKKK